MSLNSVGENVHVKSVGGLRLLFVADARGALERLNKLAEQHKANAVIHTGSFGFFDKESVTRASSFLVKSLSALHTNGSPARSSSRGDTDEPSAKAPDPALSELPEFLSGAKSFTVPVYTICGSREDVAVVQRFCNGEYSVPNLHLIDETHSHLLGEGTERPIRLIGVGGTFSPRRLYNAGAGTGSAAGFSDNVWIGSWQLGALLEADLSKYDNNEIRIFLSHDCVSTCPLLYRLATHFRADYSVSSSLHFKYTSSFSQVMVTPLFEQFKEKLEDDQAELLKAWGSISDRVAKSDKDLDVHVKHTLIFAEYLAKPLAPELPMLEDAFGNMWHFNLCDIEYGSLLISIDGSCVGAQIESKGFDFATRKYISPQEAENAEAEAPRDEKSLTKVLADTSLSSPAAAQTQKTASHKSRSERKSKTSKSREENHRTRKEEREKEGKHKIVRKHSLWFREGSRSKEEILALLRKDDVANVTEVIFQESPACRPDGTRAKHALVYFETPEQVANAYEGVDKDKAGSVSINRTVLLPGSRR